MAKALVLAEHREGRVKKASLEAISTARRLAGTEPVTALLVGGGAAATALAAECGRHGADAVLTVDGAGFESYAPEAWRDALLAALKESAAEFMLLAATGRG